MKVVSAARRKEVRAHGIQTAINWTLQSHDPGRLEDGAGLMSPPGLLVEDREHLRSLLARESFSRYHFTVRAASARRISLAAEKGSRVWAAAFSPSPNPAIRPLQ